MLERHLGLQGKERALPRGLLRIAICGTLATLLFPEIGIAQPTRYDDAGEYFFKYQGENRGLTLSKSQFWIYQARSNESLSEEVEATADGWKFQATRGNWSLFSSPNASAPPREGLKTRPATVARAAEAVNDVIDRLGDRGFVSPVFIDPDGYELSFNSRIVLRFRSEVSSDEARRMLEELSFDIVKEGVGPISNSWLVSSREARSAFETLTFANDLTARGKILWAEPDQNTWNAKPHSQCEPITPTLPTDPNHHWGLTGTWGINVQPAWDICGGADASNAPLVKVAVIDDGIDLGGVPGVVGNHLDLPSGANFNPGQNFASENSTVPTGSNTDARHRHDDDWLPNNQGDPYNCEGHGTQVAGVIAMLNNLEDGKQFGSVGVVPEGAIVAARAQWSDYLPNPSNPGQVTCGWKANQVTSEMASALGWATGTSAGEGGAQVVVHSWEVPQSNTLDNAYQALFDDGVVAVSSAGNGNSAGLTFPARLPTVLAVGGNDDQG